MLEPTPAERIQPQPAYWEVDMAKAPERKLTKYRAEMGEAKHAVLTQDYSTEAGYTMKVELAQPEPQTLTAETTATPERRVVKTVSEHWARGERVTTVWSDDTETTNLITAGLTIETVVTATGMSQRTECTMAMARLQNSQLIVGAEEFFIQARLMQGSSRLNEILTVDDARTINRHLEATDDNWSGGRDPKEYRKTVLISDNGVISRGSGVHQVHQDFRPQMFEVR